MTSPHNVDRSGADPRARASVGARASRGPVVQALRDRMALTPEDASVFMGIACATLKKWRCAGDGPAYVKVGSKVVYLVEDLESFLRAHRVA